MQGVPWHSLANSSLDATPLFFVSKNSGPLKKAGDPAFALLFIGGIIHIFAVQALYVRWAGRESRIPHTAKVRFFAISVSGCLLRPCSLAPLAPPQSPGCVYEYLRYCTQLQAFLSVGMAV